MGVYQRRVGNARIYTTHSLTDNDHQTEEIQNYLLQLQQAHEYYPTNGVIKRVVRIW